MAILYSLPVKEKDIGKLCESIRNVSSDQFSFREKATGLENYLIEKYNFKNGYMHDHWLMRESSEYTEHLFLNSFGNDDLKLMGTYYLKIDNKHNERFKYTVNNSYWLRNDEESSVRRSLTTVGTIIDTIIQGVLTDTITWPQIIISAIGWYSLSTAFRYYREQKNKTAMIQFTRDGIESMVSQVCFDERIIKHAIDQTVKE